MTSAGGSPVTLPEVLVVDASVVIKWHVREIHTEASLRLLREDVPPLHAPDLLLPEIGNILWKKARRGELSEEQARRIGCLLRDLPVTLHPAAPLIEAALEISLRTGATVYDSLYVALAVYLDSTLVTADERLVRLLADSALGVRVSPVENDFR
jgi:predicted nucleic acid-binding protein